ncbi:MAG: Ig-like domain-containing protein [Burkholderiales bacterium]|nr:Ig-like domain-containing protein [Burkholderiales bacterium]
MNTPNQPCPLRLRLWRSCVSLFLVMLVVACGGGGGDDTTTPGGSSPTVTAITVTVAATTVGVGQTRTATAEARDQNGAVMSGVSFTWASSNAGVATVSGGVVTGVAVGSTGITASSGGVTSNVASLGVTPTSVGSVVVDKPALFLPGSGQAAQLAAQVLDPQGAAASANVSWSSSAPDKVSVDAAGRVLALAIGSAQIVAQAGGVRSAPSLVVVAQPMAGALLVSDAQVVAVGTPLRLAPGAAAGVGTEYEVTLTGVATPAIGSLLIAAETAPVAGRVVASRAEPAGLVVTLALVPLPQLFSAYDIRFDIDLSAFGFEPVPDRAAARARSTVWSAAERARALARERRLDVFEPFKVWDCDASIKAKLLAAPISLSLDNKLHLVLEDRPGHSKHALEGSADIVGSAGIKVDAGFEAKGECKAQGQLKLPVFGWFSAIVMPAVRFGIGAELKSEVLLVQGELSGTGKIGFEAVLGWECGGATAACRGLDQVKLTDNFKATSKIPSENDMQAKISGQFFAIAGLDAAIFFGAANAELVEARIGPKQAFDLAFEDDQVARLDYAASYTLSLDGVVKPGSALQKAIEAVVGDDSTAVSFQAAFTSKIAESPKGVLSVSKNKVRPDAPVDFTVDLDPATVAYGPLGYNVTGVELYRRREGELKFTPFKFMDLIATHTATYRWVPALADAGRHEFAALVKTAIDVPLLEVAANSIKEVEVACFAASAQALDPAARARAQAAPATGARERPQALACVDSWAGTATYIAKTPGLPTANIEAHSTVTWTWDHTEGGAPFEFHVYKPRGSFTLAFNSPDNCTFALAPNTFTIVDNPLAPAKLVIMDNPLTGATYGIGGVQLIDTTVTASCPGRPDTVSELRGFQVFFATGSGPYVNGQTTLAGSIEDAATTASWSFSRP